MVAKVEGVVVKKVLGLLADTSGNVGRPRRNWVRITKRRTKFSTISHLWREEVGVRVSEWEEVGTVSPSSSLLRMYHHRHRLRGEKVVPKIKSVREGVTLLGMLDCWN